MEPTQVPVAEFLATVPERRAAEAEQLIALMAEVTGEEPVMWGPSIIGFGSVPYRTPAGREGLQPASAFSPRKAALTIYLSPHLLTNTHLMGRIGKHKAGKSCLYLTRLTDADPEVLRELIIRSHREAESAARSGSGSSVRGGSVPSTRTGSASSARDGSDSSARGGSASSARDGSDSSTLGGSASSARGRPRSVADYVASVPLAARPGLDVLRDLVREVVPQAEEVVSYGIIGYRMPGRRKAARVFVSGWKDHVAMYPLPAATDPALAADLKPWIRGKGTLWFGLDEELPTALLRRAVAAMTGTDDDPTSTGDDPAQAPPPTPEPPGEQ